VLVRWRFYLISGRVALQAPGVVGTGHSFTNAGTINGSVSLGEGGNNTFIAVTGSTVSAGDSTPGVTPSSGVTGVTFANAGTIYSGGSNNTLVLQNSSTGPSAGTGGTGTVSGDTYQGFQNLQVNSGTWNLTGGQLVSGSSGTVELNGGVLRPSSSNQLGTGLISSKGGALSSSFVALSLNNDFGLGAGGLTLSGSNAIALNGVLSGVGSLTVASTPVTLNGANLYSGGTQISSGAFLTGNTISIQGDIVNNGSVTFNQASAGTYSGAMSGSGSLIKSGIGSLTLAGSNISTGNTEVRAGTLAVLPDLRSRRAAGPRRRWDRT